MPYGLQCFDAETGLMTLDVTDRLTRIVGRVEIGSTPFQSGRVVVSESDMQGGQLFIYSVNSSAFSIYDDDNDVSQGIEIQGNIIDYKNISFSFVYGVY